MRLAQDELYRYLRGRLKDSRDAYDITQCIWAIQNIPIIDAHEEAKKYIAYLDACSEENYEDSEEEVTQEEISEYLDDIRNSGLINILEAVQHIMGVFDISKADAKAFWIHWATHFGENNAEG